MALNKLINLNKFIFFNLLTISLISTSLIGLLWFLADYRYFNEMIAEQEATFYDQKKQMLRDEVGRVVNYIDYMKATTESRLKQSIRSRTYEAYEIASAIYKENEGNLTEAEIKVAVKNVLRRLRFNNGRGYYFATRLDGLEELFADRPELEGVNLIDMQDTQGQFVIRDMIELVRTQGEGFYRYTWTQPEKEGRDFPKIAFIKYFEPLDWFIGTGEYLDDVADDIQKEVIDRIEQVRFGKDGYVFAGTLDGISLAGPAKGRNMLQVTDPNGVKIVQELISAARDGGRFVRYTMPEFEGLRNAPKLSYAVMIEDWGWYIGAGEYVGDIEAIISAEQVRLQERVRTLVISILSILLTIFVTIFLWARFIAGRVKANFSQFSSFFTEAATQHTRIDIEQLDIVELSDLASSANKMIEARNDTERKLHENKNWVDTILESIQSGIVVIDVETQKIMEANTEAARILGRSKSEILGRSCHEFMHQHEKGQCPIVNLGKDVLQEEQAIVTPEGQKRPVLKTASRIDSEGREYLIESFIDITEIKTLEERLRQSEQIQALGTLAGGIAHDFNNLMMGIQGRTSIMLQDVPPDNPNYEHLQSITQYIKTASNLTTQLLGIARGGKYDVQPTDINEILHQQVVLFSRTKKEIQISEHYASAIWSVEVDGNQMIQVIWNLFINAGHAMGEGGMLSIETENSTISEQEREANDVSPGNYVRLTIKDNGIGMDEETMRKAFDPFFTTKEKDRGTGLGLASVYGIIKNHKGHITLRSKPGVGTTVYILLPASDKRPVKSDDKPPAITHGEGMILLIDDEKMVRDVGSEMLKILGYNVLVAADGEQGVELYQEHKESISAVILDMIMPTMGGKETFRKLKEIDQDVKVMLSSGYSRDGDMETLLSEGCQGFIQKPFSLEKLSNELKKVLDS